MSNPSPRLCQDIPLSGLSLNNGRWWQGIKVQSWDIQQTLTTSVVITSPWAVSSASRLSHGTVSEDRLVTSEGGAPHSGAFGDSQEGEAEGPGQTRPFCEESVVHITAFEEMYLEREDHISVQLCWQPAVGPGVSHHANHIYEQGGWCGWKDLNLDSRSCAPQLSGLGLTGWLHNPLLLRMLQPAAPLHVLDCVRLWLAW